MKPLYAEPYVEEITRFHVFCNLKAGIVMCLCFASVHLLCDELGLARRSQSNTIADLHKCLEDICLGIDSMKAWSFTFL